MKTLNFINHNIDIYKNGDTYIVSPKYFKDFNREKEDSMGDIILSKEELAIFIVNLTNLIHGNY
jgi:hypothetical protein